MHVQTLKIYINISSEIPDNRTQKSCMCAFCWYSCLWELGALQDGVDAENCTLTITTHTFTIAKTAHVFSNNNTASPMLPKMG
jgi:hypothetical protein